MSEHFRPIEDEYINMPKTLNYQLESGSRVEVVFGTEFGHPATRFCVKDSEGRIVKEGGSLAISFDQALVAGLGDRARQGREILKTVLNQ